MVKNYVRTKNSINTAFGGFIGIAIEANLIFYSEKKINLEFVFLT